MKTVKLQSSFFLEKGKVLQKLESKFQSELIKEIQKRLPGCLVMKNDPNYIQGIPDLIVLFGNKWAALECKRSSAANRQPNQEYYIQIMNQMSFGRFIYPENKEEVLDEIQRSFNA